jgi:Mn2+/Fe2+ NRAMP family transporter
MEMATNVSTRDEVHPREKSPPISTSKRNRQIIYVIYSVSSLVLWISVDRRIEAVVSLLNWSQGIF